MIVVEDIQKLMDDFLNSKTKLSPMNFLINYQLKII